MTRHNTDVLVTLYEAWHARSHHGWLHRVEHSRRLTAVYVPIIACDARRARKVEPFSTSMVAAAQMLRCWRRTFPYYAKCPPPPRQDPGSDRRQYADGLWLYENQP